APVARGEDKRNELRLKLELDLGKSSTASQQQANGSSQQTHEQQHEQAAVPLQRPRGNFSAQPQLTNSLGEAIGKGRHLQQQQQQQHKGNFFGPPSRDFGNFDAPRRPSPQLGFGEA
ncbi:Hypothetical predicted protein, partial [Olea europaea subsp. europaea]